MRLATFTLVALVAFCGQSAPGYAQSGRAAEIIQRLEHANLWRDHVLIAAHRGGWKERGITILPENSIAGIEYSIAVGAEIVEIDVRRSKDGELVVMHDSWLDRTTTCHGEVVERTVADLRQCRVVVGSTRVASDERVATLREVLQVTKGRILVNVDNKIGYEAIPAIAAVASDLGMADEIIVKENIWNRQRLDEVRAVLPQSAGIRFLPIIADDAVEDPRFVEEITKAFEPDAAEMVAWRGERTLVPSDPGALFGSRMRAVAARGDWHIWVNTYPIVNKPSGFLARGRGDELAVAAGFPEEVYGYWAERGATIIQTDEPKAAIEWLEANGWRVPYAEPASAAPSQSTASIN